MNISKRRLFVFICLPGAIFLNTVLFTNFGWVTVRTVADYLSKETGSGIGSDLNPKVLTDRDVLRKQSGARHYGKYSIIGKAAHFNLPNVDLTSVKDQGRRGTCAAFATISAMEQVLASKQNMNVNLSEQAIYYMRDVWGGNFEWGGGLKDMHDEGYSPEGFVNNFGYEGYVVPYEKVWNYNPSLSRTGTNNENYNRSCANYDEMCSNTSGQGKKFCSGGKCVYVSPVRKITAGFKSQKSIERHNPAKSDRENLLSLIAALSSESGSATTLSIGVSRNFENPGMFYGYDAKNKTAFENTFPNGYVTMPSQKMLDEMPAKYRNTYYSVIGYHAVHAVGFVSNKELKKVLPEAPLDPAGLGYVIIKNSWGLDWEGSDHGYAYLPGAYFLFDRKDKSGPIQVGGITLLAKGVVPNYLGFFGFSRSWDDELVWGSKAVTKAEAKELCKAKLKAFPSDTAECWWDGDSLDVSVD